MPNAQRKGFKAKAGGRSGGAGNERSAATGKKMGKRAAASANKNRNAADEYIDDIEENNDLDRLFRVKTLARVIRPFGAGRIVVMLQSGEEVETMIAGSLRFHGRAATKTDRPNCIVLNSVVLLDGGRAVSNLSTAHIARVREVYASAGVRVSSGFFHGTVGADADDSSLQEGFDWDYSDTLASDAVARAAQAADEERRRLARGDRVAVEIETETETVAETAINIDDI